jgi:hypothetical protein
MRIRLIALAALSLAALCQTIPRTAPIPNDPLEMITGPVQVVDTWDDRQAALLLLARARGNESLKSAGRGYDLKVSFTVNSGGQTEYDGDWEMEEIFSPQYGTRWTAKGPAGYTTTQISADNRNYAEGAEGTAGTIPLRLHEARSALFGALPTNGQGDLIRTATAKYNGVPVTCCLLAGSEHMPTAAPGRRWDENEECIDPQTRLLQMHSQVPGMYSGYDYTDAPKLGDRVLPRNMILTEGGKTVVRVHVESLTEMTSADSNLFVPTAAMKAGRQSVGTTGAQKTFVIPQSSPIPADAIIQPVCVFGVIAPSGQLVEAHSVQPGDPNSKAALEFAKSMTFPAANPTAARPLQRFVFIIEKFVAPR